MKLNIQLFAGSVSIGTITETIDIDTNQSTFTIPATMTTSGQTFNNDNAYMTLQWRYEGGSSWTTISKKTFGIGQNASKTKSWTLSLTHEDDGTLTDVQFRVQWYITSSTNGTTSATTYTPTTIPRASEIANVTTGTTPYYPTITWTPNSNTFKYKIKYTNSRGTNSATSSIISPGTTEPYTYFSLQIGDDFFVNVGSATQTATATLYTYKSDGTTLIGEKTKTFSITLNTYIKGTISISNLTEADETMQSLNWGVYVKGKSKLSYRTNYYFSSPVPTSATITSNTNGEDFSANATINVSTQTKTFTTKVLSTTGANTITAKVTDSRGRTTNATSQTYNVIAYSNPTISTAQVQRCDVNGNITNEGDYCYISYGASISSCSNNNKTNTTYKVGYRVHNTGDYDYVNLADTLDSYSASGMLYTDGIYPANRGSGTKLQLSSSNTYDIQFYVEDTFTESTNVQVLDTGFDLMNFNANGKAMAIGKVSEATGSNKLLEIALPTKFTERIKDELVVDSIRSKNMIDKSTIVAGSIDGTSTTIRLNTRQVLWLPAGTYTCSCDNITSPFRYGIQVQNIGVPPLSTWPSSFIYDSGWKTDTSFTFTITNAGWCTLMISKENNVTLTPGEASDFNFQLEEGSTATDYSPYQNLDGASIENGFDNTQMCYYTKFSDGTLIKFGYYTIGSISSGGYTHTFNMEVPFINNEYSVITTKRMGGTANFANLVDSVSIISQSSFSIITWCNSGSFGGGNNSYLCIGRWK